MVVRETEALSSPFSEESEPLSWIPEILRERGLVTTLEEYQGNSPRLQGLQLLDKIKPYIQEKHGLDFYQPNIVILKDGLFRIYVQSEFSFPEEVKLPLIELIQKALEHSETKMLSVRRAYWTPENPDPPGSPFNALATSEEVLEAIKTHYKYSMEQNWHKRPEVEVSLNLQEFTDPQNVKIENGELVGNVVSFGGEVIPRSSNSYSVHVLPGDNRAITMKKSSSIAIEINSHGPRIIDKKTISVQEALRDREGTLVPFRLPTSMQVDFLPLNDADALRLACAAHELQEHTKIPHRIEFSAGTREGRPVVFVNEALPYRRPSSLEVEREPEIIKGSIIAIVKNESDVAGSRGFHARKGEMTMVYIDPLLSTDTTRFRFVLSRLAKEQERRERPIVCLYPGTETEHAFRVLAREIGLTGFPVIQGRRFRVGDRVLVRTDGVEHIVTNLTLAGNRYGVCLQEYPEPFTDLHADLQIGNKGEGLLRLLSLGLPVPPTFVLTRNFFHSTLRRNTLTSRWGRLTKIELPEDLLKKFTELNEGLRELPQRHWGNFLKLIRSHLDVKKVKLIARSSGNVEDLATRSFTGEFQTVPNLTIENLEKGVLEVIRSPFTENFARAIWELAPDEGRRVLAGLTMSVIVMPQVQAEVSGTLFHCDTVTGSPSVITIEAQPGIGGVVAGDERERTLRIKFDAQTGDILSIIIIEGGVVSRPKSLTTREETLLTADEVKALFNAARLIHRRTNEYHDTEWGIGALPSVLLDGGFSDHKSQLWFFQTRPIRTSL